MTDFAAALATLHTADAALQAAGPTPFPVPLGSHAPLVAGAVSALGRGDWWAPGLRERAGAVLRGASVERLVDAREGARPYRVLPSGPDPALRALQTVGLAMADPERCALAHVGTGALGDGRWHEALNLAGLYRANVIFVLALHPLGAGAPLGAQSAAKPSELARCHGLTVHEVDGADAQAVHDAVRAARDARGPHLVVARLAAPRV
ncbi:MAG: 2-oxoisovalerate dehydrogenase E1 component alpha subunit [Myxococcota bacterium]